MKRFKHPLLLLLLALTFLTSYSWRVLGATPTQLALPVVVNQTTLASQTVRALLNQLPDDLTLITSWQEGSDTYYVLKERADLPPPPLPTNCDVTAAPDEIPWDEVPSGGTVCIPEGTYTTDPNTHNHLNVRKDNVTIRGIGRVILFGGRSRELPYCGQSNYQDENIAEIGIDIRGRQNVTIENLIIHGYETGLYLRDTPRHITLRELKIYNNGIVRNNGNPNGHGVKLDGHHITFERVEIHDNGQDQIQSKSNANIGDVTIRDSWFYNSRRHPTRTDESFNYCTHTDGLQIYSGDRVSGVLIERSWFGPGLTQAVVLGDNKGGGIDTTVSDVTLRHVTAVGMAGIGIYAKHPGNERLTLDHVTVECGDRYTGVCLLINNRDTVTISNSIIVGSNIDIPNATLQTQNNCQYRIPTGEQNYQPVGDTINPQFRNIPNDPMSFNGWDLTPQDGRCVGSALTTIPRN